ncbi:nuclear transport factor 2 family protein [Sphingomonas sp. ST-64]|uniref:Nuclear transport factor 2 family protein n=1 Tax=Sphingomonas plantiphila TaxID=3163295 RepID=A0ABW8YJJ4_9SPHN
MSIDHHARLDVHDLLARFCHAIDRGDTRAWLELFTGDGTFECGEGGTFAGRAELTDLLSKIRECVGDCSRHLITAVVINRGATWRDLHVEAYGPVMDLRNGGMITEFYDYEFHLRLAGQWRVRAVSARHIGSTAPLLQVNDAKGVNTAAHRLN